MPIFTTLAQSAIMWALALLLQIKRHLHRDSTPNLDSIGHSIRIRAIQLWTTESLTALATLMIDPSVVSWPGVESDGDCYHFAWPTVWRTWARFTCKPAHDMCVVFSFAGIRVVSWIELELVQVRFWENFTNVFVQIGVERPAFLFDFGLIGLFACHSVDFGGDLTKDVLSTTLDDGEKEMIISFGKEG